MPQGKLKQKLVVQKARQDRVIKRQIADAVPAGVKDGKAAIEDRTKPKDS